MSTASLHALFPIVWFFQLFLVCTRTTTYVHSSETGGCSHIYIPYRYICLCAFSRQLYSCALQQTKILASSLTFCMQSRIIGLTLPIEVKGQRIDYPYTNLGGESLI